MPLTLTWQQIALRLALACVASFVVGLNRDEQGNPAGIRTTMLVCLAATLAMMQANVLLPISGKTPSSFAVMDLMRLPLGILSGIGFIGAGAIIKRGDRSAGVTTAATLWFVTVLGLLFGGGQLRLAISAFLLAVFILWALKPVKHLIPRNRKATLRLTLCPGAPTESNLRNLLESHGQITRWHIAYEPPEHLASLECDLRWPVTGTAAPHTPDVIERLRILPAIRTITWDE